MKELRRKQLPAPLKQLFSVEKKALTQLFSVEKKALKLLFFDQKKLSSNLLWLRKTQSLVAGRENSRQSSSDFFSQYLVLDVTQSLSHECWFGKTLSSTQMEALSICLFLHSGSQPLSFQSLPLLPSQMFHIFIYPFSFTYFEIHMHHQFTFDTNCALK